MRSEECAEKVFHNLGYESVRLAAPETASTERPGNRGSDAEHARKWGLKVGDVVGTCHDTFSKLVFKTLTLRYIGDQAIVFDRKEWSVSVNPQLRLTSLQLPFGGTEERTVCYLWGSTWWLLKPRHDRWKILEGEEEAKPEELTEEVWSRNGWVTGFRMTISGPQPTIVSGSLIESMSAVRAAPRDGSDPQRIKTTARYRCGFDAKLSHLLSAEHHSCLASAHARYQQLLEKVKEKP
jgi:hypothetical protein